MTAKRRLAGYSGTPLAKKLGVSEGGRLLVEGAPAGYEKLLNPLPPNVKFVKEMGPDTDIIHLFVTKRAELAKRLSVLLSALRSDGVIWVSWPKKAAKIATDITENVIREVALPLGLVDIKVCAVDETWSGLKLVIRRVLRPSGR